MVIRCTITCLLFQACLLFPVLRNKTCWLIVMEVKKLIQLCWSYLEEGCKPEFVCRAKIYLLTRGYLLILKHLHLWSNFLGLVLPSFLPKIYFPYLESHCKYSNVSNFRDLILNTSYLSSLTWMFPIWRRYFYLGRIMKSFKYISYTHLTFSSVPGLII